MSVLVKRTGKQSKEIVLEIIESNPNPLKSLLIFATLLEHYFYHRFINGFYVRIVISIISSSIKHFFLNLYLLSFHTNYLSIVYH